MRAKLAIAALVFVLGAAGAAGADEVAAAMAARDYARAAKLAKEAGNAEKLQDAKALGEAKERIIARAKRGGRKPRLTVEYMRQRTRSALASADAEGYELTLLGAKQKFTWAKTSDRRFFRLAKACLNPRVGEDNMLLARVCVAFGFRDEAENALTQAAQRGFNVNGEGKDLRGRLAKLPGGAETAVAPRQKPGEPAAQKPPAKEEPESFDAKWAYVSETSAVIYWRLPRISDSALSYVEYGDGRKTKITSEPRWAQFHRITGLETGKSYSYRMVNVDPLTKKETKSAVLTLQTKAFDGKRITSAPYAISSPGRYILTQDVRSGADAITVTAGGVFLDLDGHTIVYGETSSKQVNGVFVKASGKVTVCNGHIEDGKAAGAYGAAVQGRYNAQPLTVFGISTDVDNYCQYPLKLFGACKDIDIHHNHFYSRVTEIENRHYPGNHLLRLDGMQGSCEVYDNLVTEGCHWGIGMNSKAGAEKIEVHHNDIRHHQQYVNGYAFGASAAGADIHHNRVTSTGRCVHLTGNGVKFHDNYCDTKGHMTLSDLPAGSRPWKHRRVELHGIKFEGRNSKNCKVYNNFMRITQYMPVDSQGKGDPADKVVNGIYVRSKASTASATTITDPTARWETQRWRGYWVKYDPDRPAAKITSSNRNSISGSFPGAAEGCEYTIYFKWDYVAATPLNVACYSGDAMNEVYNNEIVAITHHNSSRRGGYGATGNWASSIYFVGMNKGSSPAGKYAIYIHDNTFRSNDCFISGRAGGPTIRIEKNKFFLITEPHTTSNKTAILSRGISSAVINAIKAGANEFHGMNP